MSLSASQTAEWRAWLGEMFPAYVAYPFAPRHAALWEWVWSVEPAQRPAPFVAIWPRGGGKSTTAELACTAIGLRNKRRYAVYVSGTQEQADKHVASIAGMLERAGVERALNKYGHSKGWRRNQLRTADGCMVDAFGLDTGVRGVKIDEFRPDLIVLDDIDDKHDSPAATRKKIETITTTVLPAGTMDVAVLAVQNLVIPDGVFARLADGRADFLIDRTLSGPFPAIHGLSYAQQGGRFVITEGAADWAGQDVRACQGQIDTIGLTAFLQEMQHDVADPDGGMFSHLDYTRCAWDAVPKLARICVWCDPAVTNTDESDCHGIHADGIADNRTIYRLWSWEQRTSPQDTLRRAILKAIELGAEVVGVETDQGGDTWQSVYLEALRKIQDEGLVPDGTRLPAFRSAKAGSVGASKAERASRMLADYERGRFVHVLGTHTILERSLKRFPKMKPFDLVDAAYWSWHYLTGGGMSNSAIGAFG